MLTLQEYLSSPPAFSVVRVTRSLVLCVCFVDRCLYFFFWPLYCLFFFDMRILIAPFAIFKFFDYRRRNGLFHKVFRCDSYCDMCFFVTFLVTSFVFGTVVVACVSIVTFVVFWDCCCGECFDCGICCFGDCCCEIVIVPTVVSVAFLLL